MNTDRLARTAIMSCLIIGVMLLLTAGILYMIMNWRVIVRFWYEQPVGALVILGLMIMGIAVIIDWISEPWEYGSRYK